ncbi:hypothetical protein H5410_056873 [Solanum commersonii]|uniref:Replication factor A C-terminal domain-containing protein n=1 Tax=Solanum commersonii TaxID=4109 RepID=A0A9J5WLF2_SOLCO|nr:hypothetical protein H5410_056873 [Solanum commersonii]
MEHTTITLWGDFAENDSRFGIFTILVSNVLINPIFEKATDLRAWREIIKADNKDIMVTPSKVMRRVIEVPLVHILDGLLDDSKDCLYKFKETIIDILNKDEPGYLSCNTCRKKVKVIEDVAACMSDGEQHARVILFEVAKYLLGCSMQDYIESTSVKVQTIVIEWTECNAIFTWSHAYLTCNLPTNIFNCLHLIEKEECNNCRKLVLSKDKQFNFLVKVDMTDSNHRRSLIAEEIHQLEDEAPIIVEEEVKSVRKYRKRAKKTTNAAAQRNLKKPKANKIRRLSELCN